MLYLVATPIGNLDDISYRALVCAEQSALFDLEEPFFVSNATTNPSTQKTPLDNIHRLKNAWTKEIFPHRKARIASRTPKASRYSKKRSKQHTLISQWLRN